MWISANGHGGQILAHVPVYLLCMSYRFAFNKYLLSTFLDGYASVIVQPMIHGLHPFLDIARVRELITVLNI